MTLVAVIIGLPMFFEIGLVLLLPVIVLVTQRSQMPLMRIAIPALAGLSVLHGLVPPHPGPLIAISAVTAELGTTPALGLLVAIPTVIICGPLFSRLAARWVPVGAPAVAGGIDTQHGADMEGIKRRPSFPVTLLTIIFPVVLMLLKAVVDIGWPDAGAAPPIRVVLDFVGQPLVAMTLAVLLAILTFGYAVRFTGNQITSKIGASLGPIAGSS
jgi:GntP family gluconate:H+ symporter